MLGPRLAGLIDQTVRQSAGQVAGVEDLLLEEIQRADLLHLDETPWRENGEWLWLWVFNAVTTVVYFIGTRGAEIFINALQGPFRGGLMSDGYAVYRSYLNRIRGPGAPPAPGPRMGRVHVSAEQSGGPATPRPVGGA